MADSVEVSTIETTDGTIGIIRDNAARQSIANLREGKETVGSVAWENVKGKPSTFPPSAHTHSMSQITDLGVFGGASATAAGSTGLVPQPAAGDQDKYLSAKGTWENITGNISGTKVTSANSADKLTTSRTLTIGNTGKSFDGSANVSWSLSEIGALPVNGKAVDSDNLDGFNENAFLRYRGSTSTEGTDTLWSQIGIREYDNAHPEGITDGYNYGSVVSLPGGGPRFDLWYNHLTSSNGDGLRYRTGWYEEKIAWATILDSVNYNKFAPTKTGTGASGTWGINVTGNAGTVNGHTVNSDVPSGAKFTDTTYGAATQSSPGLMLAADKKAIDREFFRLLPRGGTHIPANADLNTIEYIKVGTYYNPLIDESMTIKNIPVGSAFIMYVLAPLSEVYDNESTDTWVYRLRIFITYDGHIFTQLVVASDTPGNFSYGPWVKMTNSNDLGAVSNKSAKYTLAASNWSGSSAPYTYDLGPTYGANAIIGFDSAVGNTTQLEAARAADIQGSSTTKIYAYGDKPTVDIPIVIIYQ